MIIQVSKREKSERSIHYFSANIYVLYTVVSIGRQKTTRREHRESMTNLFGFLIFCTEFGTIHLVNVSDIVPTIRWR